MPAGALEAEAFGAFAEAKGRLSSSSDSSEEEEGGIAALWPLPAWKSVALVPVSCRVWKVTGVDLGLLALQSSRLCSSALGVRYPWGQAALSG